jgi:hypothetical protein
MSRAHGKCAVALLPMEVVQCRSFQFDPVRTITFQIANQTRDIVRLGQPAKNMNMVGDAANQQGWRILVFADAREVSKHAGTEFGVNEKWLTVFCGEDDMCVDLHERLGHGCTVVEPLRGSMELVGINPGFAEYREPWALLFNAFGVSKPKTFFAGSDFAVPNNDASPVRIARWMTHRRQLRPKPTYDFLRARRSSRRFLISAS